MALLEIALYIALFLAFSFSFAFFLKKKFKAQVIFRIVSIVRSKKPLPVFEKFAKFKNFFHWFANIALVLGFGSIAADYLYGRHLSRFKRLVVFASSFLVLYAMIFALLGRNATATVSANSVLLFSSFALFGCAGLSMVLLAVNAFDILQKIFIGEKAIAGIAPLIPGVQIPNVPIFVPLHGWLSLLIILVVHEAAHGILARVHKIRVKSSGLILLGFLPLGAFVEPDEKQFKREGHFKRLQVLAVGSMANFALFFVAFLVFTALFAAIVSPFVQPIVVVQGVNEFSLSVNGVKEKSPAFGKLFAGDEILSINGTKVSSIEELQNAVKKDSVLSFSLKDVNGIARLESIEKNSVGIIGAFFEQPIQEGKINPLGLLLVEFFYWLFLLNLFVAIANFMPLVPFDGGQIVKLLFIPYIGFLGFKTNKESEKFIGRVFLWIMGILILINVLPLFQF